MLSSFLMSKWRNVVYIPNFRRLRGATKVLWKSWTWIMKIGCLRSITKTVVLCPNETTWWSRENSDRWDRFWEQERGWLKRWRVQNNTDTLNTTLSETRQWNISRMVIKSGLFWKRSKFMNTYSPAHYLTNCAWEWLLSFVSRKNYRLDTGTILHIRHI